MTPEESRLYVHSLYENLLKRAPRPDEFEHWTKLAQARPAERIYYEFVNCKEYKIKTKVSSLFPPGHYYSPVVDPESVRDYVGAERQPSDPAFAGIPVPLHAIEALWRRWSTTIASTPFGETKRDAHRFYYDNNIFPYGDAISLRAMIADLRPRRIIEIGSGYSSACMLDCADEFQLDTTFTFIDPFPKRLKGLLRSEDHRRAAIIEAPVQQTELGLYDTLERGDILFIDSTHVLKTGSDVHHELFHILPRLRSGVVIHFHDIQYPFEYPDQWIFRDNLSWNEIYAVRAFLMYNTSFQIKFWGSCLANKNAGLVREVYPLFLKNPGGSLWIEKK